ncbi:CehA/McbA family metallohydrolase [candidate division KSB1 bacterium]|nr:CehA/McbA family metallohydrolase [candidate division KSB1 bacterium]
MNQTLLDYFLPVILYAETHYAFKGIYSRLKKKEPEIVFDAPHRIEPDSPIPVLMLCKDAHIYPVKVKDVEFVIMKEKDSVHVESHRLDEMIQDQFYWKIFEIQLPAEIFGNIQLDATFRIEINGRTKIYRNDNYRISSHLPFDICLADRCLPKSAGWYYGDLHYHSSYTNDQVEFGAPLEPTMRLAKAMGLSFYAVTDHSYDLDDHEDDHLKNDPFLSKWKRLQNEVKALNESSKFSFRIIPGEEVSCGNKKNRNIHALLLNNPEFIAGQGDSAEKWFRTSPDFTLREVLDMASEQSVVIAAHPEINPPLLQWLLIRRGKWHLSDYLHDGIIGLQVWNSQDNHYFHQGLQSWIKLLLLGKRKFIFAGNDAHGNFNRFRQIGFPFWTFRENKKEIFGQARTGIFVIGEFTEENIIKSIRNGRAIITNGPFAEIQLITENNACAAIGDEVIGQSCQLKIAAYSTGEFGSLTKVCVLIGNLPQKREEIVLEKKDFRNCYVFENHIAFESLPESGYFRMEAQSGRYDVRKCFTNPIWFKRTSR